MRPLFGPLQTPNGSPYDVSADGQRILAVVSNEQAAPEPLTLVLNWMAGLNWKDKLLSVGINQSER